MARICSIEGCSKKVRKGKWCDMHYSRWRRHGDPHKVLPRGPKPSVPKICSIEGCDRKVHARGWCDAHYQSWLKHGDPTPIPTRRPPRMSKAEVVAYELERATPDNGCLITAVETSWSHGYGRVTFEGRPEFLHRLSSEVHLGRNLEDDELALHRCHRPACINPEHLYAGTHQQNTDDKYRAGRANHDKGEAHWYAKLTDRKVLEIRRRHKGGAVTLQQLAEEYGVVPGTISHVVKGKTWRHLSLN